MVFVIGLFTLAMVLDCVVLIGLVLIQLPKKDAGGGLAFGGSASDALFGAGSGTVLTKVTKYAATLFFVLAIVLSIMQRAYHTRGTSGFGSRIGQVGAPAANVVPPVATAPAPSTPSAPTTGTNQMLSVPLTAPEAPSTQPPSSNVAPAAPK
ncbi:Preprotein translocase, SecG subunit [Verrucomicrobia bacterium]|nr:Preprotein translocase, SecG subunit [Verrucomicrobiota bacterium]